MGMLNLIPATIAVALVLYAFAAIVLLAITLAGA